MKKEKLSINVTLDKNTVVFNPYNSEQLSDDLSNYIYSQCKGYSSSRNIMINILHSHNLSEDEKHAIIDAIRSNFGVDITENILNMKFSMFLEVFLVCFGTILLVASKVFDKLNTFVLDDVISIFGWVMIWEAAYHFLFVDIKDMFENKRFKKLTEAKISFKQIKG